MMRYDACPTSSDMIPGLPLALSTLYLKIKREEGLVTYQVRVEANHRNLHCCLLGGNPGSCGGD